MNRSRIMALGAIAGLFLTQLGCPMEPDPKVIEDCKIGEVQCLSDNRTRTCNDFGRWGGAQTFVCPFGSTCQVMGGVAVCM